MAMYPGIEYVRVEQDGVEFTTEKASVTKDMRRLKDAAATDARGNPLPPKRVRKSSTSRSSSTTTRKTTAKRTAAKKTSSSGSTQAASTQAEEATR